MVISQYQEADRAICGRGDFTLKPEYARHRLTVDVETMTELQHCFVYAYKMVRCGPMCSGVVINQTVTAVTTPGLILMSSYGSNLQFRKYLGSFIFEIQ